MIVDSMQNGEAINQSSTMLEYNGRRETKAHCCSSFLLWQGLYSIFGFVESSFISCSNSHCCKRSTSSSTDPSSFLSYRAMADSISTVAQTRMIVEMKTSNPPNRTKTGQMNMQALNRELLWIILSSWSISKPLSFRTSLALTQRWRPSGILASLIASGLIKLWFPAMWRCPEGGFRRAEFESAQK